MSTNANALVSDSAISHGAQSRTIVMIHGMWSTPVVWDNYRRFYGERGYRVVTPCLRHHDRLPGEVPHPDLGTTSVLDYAADLEAEIRGLDEVPYVIGHSMGGFLAQLMASRGLAQSAVLLASAHCAPLFALRMEAIWIFRQALFTTPFWRSTQKPNFETMQWGVLNGLSTPDAAALYNTLIPESGRTLLELALWFIDKNRAAYIEKGSVRCPMLFMTGEEDRLTPANLGRRIAQYHGKAARFELLRGHAHWLPSEPGWEHIAARALQFFETQGAGELRAAA